jgi:hypothetical protein
MEREGRLVPADERHLHRMRAEIGWSSSSSIFSRTSACSTTSPSLQC